MKHKTSKKNKSLRPTTGKVREALFDILRGRIKNARFLDLFAGTGAVGMTALREGASEVLFVEAVKGNSSEIEKSAERFHFSGKIKIITKKVLPFIEWAELNNMVFDIIFLDPPYHTDEIIDTLLSLARSGILDHKGIVIAEHFSKRQLSDRFDSLQKIKDYHYGDTVLSFYKSESPQLQGGASK
jgi:16S rRNA (guanine(966)-N(2))-methyltransferase RsmD